VTTEPGQRYEVRFQAAARRAIAQRLPEAVVAAVLKFCEAALAVNPHRVGKPLFGPLAGCHGARRGTYRIIYRIEESGRIVHVLDIDQRFSTDTPVYPQALLYHA
jgi:mRNA interferase RelE/StbE